MRIGQLPSGSYLKDVLPPAALQKKVKPSRWVQKLFPSRYDTASSARKSTRIAQQQSSDSPLFALPLDIRDRILHYTLMGTKVRFRHANSNVVAEYPRNAIEALRWKISSDLYLRSTMCYDIGPYKQNGLPPCMLVNKQTLLESLQHFHREAIFSLNNCFFTPVYEIVKPLGLFRLDKARIVRITTAITCYKDTINQESDEKEDKCYVIGPRERDKACLEQFVYHITTFSPVLHILSLSVCGLDWRQPFDLPFRSDLAFLEALPKTLQKVSFEVKMPESRQVLDNLEQPLRFFKDELRRIGKTLVGGSGALSTEEEVAYKYDKGAWFKTDDGRRDAIFWGLTVTSPAYRRAQKQRY